MGVKKTPKKYNRAVADILFNYMVVKYITMSFASHCFIVPHVIVLSLILIHSAIILACMAFLTPKSMSVSKTKL